MAMAKDHSNVEPDIPEMSNSKIDTNPAYHRYHIETAMTPDMSDLPNRFLVEVSRINLLKLIIKESRDYFGKLDVILNRPCVYGVFSGPIGGFAPRPNHCVGCLRCTIQHPDVVTIKHNPEWQSWGDTYLSPKLVDTILTEASTGAVPVKGQGYRGRFGGPGWDRIWTDMSEIVRPTRDGIHGREFISTVTDIGSKPMHLSFNSKGDVIGTTPSTLSTQLPILFDSPPQTIKSAKLLNVLSNSAQEIDSLAFMPIAGIIGCKLSGNHLVPQVNSSEIDSIQNLNFTPRLVEALDISAVKSLSNQNIKTCFRIDLDEGWEDLMQKAFDIGVRVFHMVADYHGRGDGNFIRDLIIKTHKDFVKKGIRDQVTLIGSGGIAAAEHVPKAIICGFDAVALDTPVLAAIQAQPNGECISSEHSNFVLPKSFTVRWGVQRIKNLCAAWRDQLLEIMGAMGIREVRRMRGELGRAMFQKDLEKEAFGDIDGYE
tara:strand:+ start:1319 stop:2773 length:1455 start_codon:yes stop_codon:yes gene_type:complete